MQCVMIPFFVVLPLLGFGRLLAVAASTPEAVEQQVEATFRSAMEAWAYEEYWHLWEMGTRVSQSALPREQFTDQMRRGTTRPTAGSQVEAFQVISDSPSSALIYARIGLEDKRRPWAGRLERPFLLRLEDGRWAVNLWDFIGLASYYPPDSFPNQPLLPPPPNPLRPKGMIR